MSSTKKYVAKVLAPAGIRDKNATVEKVVVVAALSSELALDALADAGYEARSIRRR